MDHWRQCIRQWFPDLHFRAYFVPPVHFNKVPYGVDTVFGQTVLVPQAAPREPGQSPQSQSSQGQCQGQCGRRSRRNPACPPRYIWHVVPQPVSPPPVFHSDLRDDRAQQHVLHCLRAIAVKQQEVMVVISQLNFGNYLNKPTYAAAVSQLPRPVTLEPWHQRGDFDVLIVHRTYGLIVGEVKSVGGNPNEVEDFSKTVLSRVKRAAEQLSKARTVLSHLVSDLVHVPVNITLTLLMPYITSEQLREALDTDSQVKKDLCDCFGVAMPSADDVDPVKLCLCQDQLSPSSAPWDISDNVMRELQKWWHKCVKVKWTKWLREERGGSDLTEDERRDLYEHLLSRFCGPATTVDVPSVTSSCSEPRSEGEGTAEVGLRMTQLTLYPQQIDLVNRGLRLVFLSGPPGTGKTVVLVLVAINWLQQDRYVIVASTWERSRAVSIMIEQQLRHSLGKGPTDDCPRVLLCHYSFDRHKNGDNNVDDAVDELAQKARDGQLYVIADEAGPEGSERFKVFCQKLAARVPSLYLWAANVHHDIRPSCLDEVQLTTPLRCPPAIAREVAASGPFKRGWIHNYTESAAPPPTDGPPVQWLRHQAGQDGHTQDDPEDCEHCGEVIADVLNKLHVGQSKDTLQYRDVLVLCDNPRDQEKDENGVVTSPATGVVRGLRARKVPVHVIRSRDQDAAVRDVALAESNHVTVTHHDVVSGLERRVVVGVGSKNSVYYVGRPYSMSRCTAQLIWINPTDDDDDDDEEDDGADADDQGNDKETSAQNTNEGERENGGSEAEDDDQNSLNSVVRKLVNDEDGELKKMDKKDGDDADPQDNSDNDRDDYADDAQRGQ